MLDILEPSLKIDSRRIETGEALEDILRENDAPGDLESVNAKLVEYRAMQLIAPESFGTEVFLSAYTTKIIRALCKLDIDPDHRAPENRESLLAIVADLSNYLRPNYPTPWFTLPNGADRDSPFHYRTPAQLDRPDLSKDAFQADSVIHTPPKLEVNAFQVTKEIFLGDRDSKAPENEQLQQKQDAPCSYLDDPENLEHVPSHSMDQESSAIRSTDFLPKDPGEAEKVALGVDPIMPSGKTSDWVRTLLGRAHCSKTARLWSLSLAGAFQCLERYRERQ
jgi:hypothetical protein